MVKIAEHEVWRKSFPYYKVQWFDNYVTAWHDVQKQFKTIQAANLYGMSLGKEYRVMEISRNDRRVIA